jgi:hypothetical protein
MTVAESFYFDCVAKVIRHNPMSTTIHTCQELYNWHAECFATLAYMIFDCAIDQEGAKRDYVGHIHFRLQCGWVLDRECLPFLKDGSINGRTMRGTGAMLSAVDPEEVPPTKTREWI